MNVLKTIEAIVPSALNVTVTLYVPAAEQVAFPLSQVIVVTASLQDITAESYQAF